MCDEINMKLSDLNALADEEQISALKAEKVVHLARAGHSFLPCDRDFGVVEGKLRPIPVYNTPNYIDLIETANSVHPYQVVAVECQSFLDYEALQGSLTWTNMKDAGLLKPRVFLYSSDFKDGLVIQD
ncbi:hypothetical protein Pcinc_018771 [Petrolisthes cinctipes]|uniref:Uncharacterized protein n=1 Tax=Petrolisthes cinctipes TaxID=88211 RepID=A0AAE1FN08_PETCI|nr:hypothetical protein Pcinc_018771 [Petrolisthes cinctipes]